jgi:hypothetical protein
VWMFFYFLCLGYAYSVSPALRTVCSREASRAEQRLDVRGNPRFFMLPAFGLVRGEDRLGSLSAMLKPRRQRDAGDGVGHGSPSSDPISRPRTTASSGNCFSCGTIMLRSASPLGGVAGP